MLMVMMMMTSRVFPPILLCISTKSVLKPNGSDDFQDNNDSVLEALIRKLSDGSNLLYSMIDGRVILQK